jgi:hypothetical protein
VGEIGPRPPVVSFRFTSNEDAGAPDPGVERPGSGFRLQGLLVTTVTLDPLRPMTYPAVNAPNPDHRHRLVRT